MADINLGVGGANSATGGYDIANSLKFETDNTEYLMAEGRPQGTQTKWTWSCWLKRTEVNNGAIAQYIFSAGSDGKLGLYFRDDSSSNGGDTIFIYVDEGNSLKWIGELRVSFRDTSAWYHIVFAVDSTDGTPADRTKIYVNGVQQTITFNSTLNQNVSTRVGDGGGKFAIGGKVANTAYGFNGYMAECVLVDGSALTPTSFGEYDDDSGIWKPKDVSSLSLGTAGFYMNFDDSSNVGAVQGGTSQGNFDKYNLSAADQALDTPTNNFCTLNPLMANAGPANYLPITEGGTKAVNTAAAYKIANSTFGVTSGKWYWEVKATDVNGVTGIGVTMPNYWDADYTLQGCIILSDGRRYNNASATSGVTNTYTDGDIISFALDMDATPPTLQVYKNNTSEANLMNGLTINGTGGAFLPEKEGGYFPKVVGYSANTFECNFGGYTSFSISSAASDANGYGTFEYAPPSGYYALCTKNLAEYG